MTEYYKDQDLERFGEIGKFNPGLFQGQEEQVQHYRVIQEVHGLV